ncbi:DUF3566 domain-containing protein [Microbacterium sp. YY-03]|uniref:DUF3566 domain-containing protein n=1 Tax=Microbacterium sp. YY-03 TaxID=3421636 RepID=UPI003D17F785
MSTVADKLAKKSSRKTTSKQVRLRVVYIDFWSAVKLSFLAGIAIAIVTLVSFFMIYTVLNATNMIADVDNLVGTISDGELKIAEYLTLPRVMAAAAVIAILNLIVTTVMGAVIAGLYNMAVKVTGGLLIGFSSN